MICRLNAWIWICSECQHKMWTEPKYRCSVCKKTKNHPIGLIRTEPGRPKGWSQKSQELREAGLEMRDKYNMSYAEIGARLKIKGRMVYYLLGSPSESFDPYELKRPFTPPPVKKRGRKRARV